MYILQKNHFGDASIARRKIILKHIFEIAKKTLFDGSPLPCTKNYSQVYFLYYKKKGRFHGALLPCGKKTPKGILVLPQEVSTLFKTSFNTIIYHFG